MSLFHEILHFPSQARTDVIFVVLSARVWGIRAIDDLSSGVSDFFESETLALKFSGSGLMNPNA